MFKGEVAKGGQTMKKYIFNQNLGNATLGVCIYDEDSLNKARLLVERRYQDELEKYHRYLKKLADIEELLKAR